MAVEDHHMIMDNREVTVLKWRNRSIIKPGYKEPVGEEFFQK
jgi:hypothetical protein